VVRRREEEPTINLTPMIDVVFLLVIFFLAGSSFRKSGAEIPLEVAGAGQLSPVARGVDPRIVDVGRDGRISLDGQTADLSGLVQELGRAVKSYPELEVMVRADREGVVRQFGEVVRSVRVAGVRRINFDMR
jgi:biopolymer transport protein ExbD